MISEVPSKKQVQVMELFGPTIQGEGIMSGTVTHFLRTGGCPLRCSWCDSLFAVLPAEIHKHRRLLTVDEILNEIKALPWAPYVTFTGGDPAIQDRLGDLIMPLNAADMMIAVETQGMFFPEWLKSCDVLTFSPKGPSSGNVVDPKPLADFLVTLGHKRRQKVCIKIVCFNEEDFLYALSVYDLIPEQYYDAFYFTAGTPIFKEAAYALEKDDQKKAEEAAGRVTSILHNQTSLAHLMLQNSGGIQLNHKVHLGCQQHVLLWPTENKGV